MPDKPSTAPTNVAASTTATVINIVYNALNIDQSGGSPITNYNVYIDDGNDGAFGAAISNTLATTYSTSALTLTAGKVYRFKYSAVNVEGEGPHSDEVAILMASVPTVPTSF